MRIVLTIMLFVLYSSTANSQKKINVLFLGNSYTYANNLPALVESIALSMGDTVVSDQNTPGGATIAGHSVNQISLNKISMGIWDYVVIQCQSQEPSLDSAYVNTNVLPYATLLDSIIKAQNPCAQTIFFMTWGRKYGDASNCQYYPPVCTYSGMQQRLRESYVQMAFDNNAWVAPIGIVWKNLRLADSTIELYSPDYSHPSIKGSYLAAATFYSALFRKNLSANSYFPPSVSAYEASLIQNCVATTVLDSLAVWNLDEGIINASFSYTTSFDTVKFVDSSPGASSWLWNFGDGTTSSLQKPVKVYSHQGIYNIKLEVNDSCAHGVAFDTISLIWSGLEDLNDVGVIVYPVPAHEKVLFKTDNQSEKVRVTLYNLYGSIVITEDVYPDSSGRFSLNLVEMKPGLYIYSLSANNRNFASGRIEIIE